MRLRNGSLRRCWREYNTVQPPWKRAGRFLTKTNTRLPCCPAPAFPGVYPRKTETSVYTKTCPQMFIAALFTMVENWIQPKCPSPPATQAVVRPYHGTLHSEKKPTTNTGDDLTESENYDERRAKKANPKTDGMIPFT